MKKYLICGGAGFIGSAFIEFLLKTQEDVQICCVDSLSQKVNVDNLTAFESDKRFNFIWGNVEARHLMTPRIEWCDILVNFASETHVDRAIVDSAPFITSNYLGVHNILEIFRKRNFENKRFIQISTDEVYGEMLEKEKATEESMLKPKNPYSATKASADLLIQSYQHTYNISATIIRLCNNFGPRQHPEKAIPLFITNAMESKTLPIYGSGLQVRQWIYVEDSVTAIEHIIRNGLRNEIYNVNGVGEMMNIDMALKILKELNADASLIQGVPDRLGHDFRYCMDDSKLRTIGWKPMFSFEDGLKRTVKWYQENENWWRVRK